MCVCQRVDLWTDVSEWVEGGGGGANLHIHRTANTKWDKGVELHSSYFKALQIIFFKKKTFKYVIFVIKDVF